MNRMTLLAAAVAAFTLSLAAMPASAATQSDARIVTCVPPTDGSSPMRDACDYDPAGGASGAQATGSGAVALAGGNALGIGSLAVSGMAIGDYSLALGGMAQGKSSIALGAQSEAAGDFSFAAMGGTAGTGAIAIGNYAVAGDAAGIALVDGRATGTASIAIGGTATGDHAVVVGGITQYGGGSGGWIADASGDYSIVIGAGVASGGFAVAMGNGHALGDQSLAFGNGSVAVTDDSVALGTRSFANRANSISLGDDGSTGNVAFQRQLTNLAAGTVDTDAVNLSQLYALAGALGGGASYSGGLFTPPTYVVQGSSYSDIGAALGAVDGKLTDLYSQVGAGVGIPGPKGDTGPAGPAGPNGHDGIDGAVGEPGAPGKDGRDGIDGLAGATGPQGPRGDTGAMGPQGPQGPAGSSDASAIRYDSGDHVVATLQGEHGTQLRNMAAGSAPTDAANVEQLQDVLRTANSYTEANMRRSIEDVRSWATSYVNQRAIDTLHRANAYTDRRVDQSIALGTAQTSMSANFRGPSSVAVGFGMSGGHASAAIGLRHVADDGMSVSIHSAFGGRDASGGVGVGYSW